MDVNDNFEIEPQHSIEWGRPTWAVKNKTTDTSIRNRYDREGGFNYAASSEIPWDDFKIMILQSIVRNHFSQDELQEIVQAIEQSKD